MAENFTQTNPEWVGDLRIRSEIQNFDGWGLIFNFLSANFLAMSANTLKRVKIGFY